MNSMMSIYHIFNSCVAAEWIFTLTKVYGSHKALYSFLKARRGKRPSNSLQKICSYNNYLQHFFSVATSRQLARLLSLKCHEQNMLQISQQLFKDKCLLFQFCNRC